MSAFLIILELWGCLPPQIDKWGLQTCQKGASARSVICSRVIGWQKVISCA